MCSENKGADQLLIYCASDLHLCFRICKKPVFSWRGLYGKAVVYLGIILSYFALKHTVWVHFRFTPSVPTIYGLRKKR